MRHLILALPTLVLLATYPVPCRAATAVAEVDPAEIVALLSAGQAEGERTLAALGATWQPRYAPMLVEILTFRRDPGARRDLVATLERGTGQSLGEDLEAWYRWLWSQPDPDHPSYATFKSLLYRQIDPRFEAYFAADRRREIRLDEVRWGGVRQDGIPPLRSPRMISARDAAYLDDSDLVFGVELGGEPRAYPKRILAWHEMFTDTIAGTPVTGVYCTLCGTLIVFESTHGDTHHRFGTSGFLYRSNKLMYDEATQSLWSTIWGRPVIGPLVGRGIELTRHAAVTTTWGEWRRRHPDTLVLSLDTGHQRDYSEGAAYREYFASDELMFGVPATDRRLANKAEVLTLVGPGDPPATLAIEVGFLAGNAIHHEALGDWRLVILTDRSGASRVYRVEDVRFTGWDGDRTATDAAGNRWRLDESALVADDGRRLPRVAATRAFWFGWFAAYPDTRLVGGDAESRGD